MAAVLISSGTLVAIGLLAWWYTHRIAALRATLDYISTTEVFSAQWLDLRRRFAELKRAGSLVTVLGANAEEEDFEQVTALCTYLNHFELTAVGIKYKIIDKNLYSEWFRGAYMKTWQDSQSFVTELRQRRDQDSLYKEFEELASEWIASAKR